MQLPFGMTKKVLLKTLNYEVHIFSCSFYTKVRREMLICKSWIAEYKKVMQKQYRDAGGALPC
jgi:hypothetical protein